MLPKRSSLSFLQQNFGDGREAGLQVKDNIKKTNLHLGINIILINGKNRAYIEQVGQGAIN